MTLGETQRCRNRPMVAQGKPWCLAENALEPDHCAAILRSELSAPAVRSQRTD